MDRCLAVYLNIHYREHVTPGKAITVCCLNIVIAASIAITAAFLDSEYTHCAFNSMLIFTRTTNIICDGLPKVLAVGITLSVSIYVIVMDKFLLKNQVHPGPVNLGVPSKSEVPSALRPTEIRRINEEPNIFYRVGSDNRELSAEAGPSQRNAANDEQNITIIFNKNGARKLNYGIDELNQQNQQNPTFGEQTTSSCTENEFFQMVKTTTTMNLFTLLYLMNFIPVVILGMVYHKCNVDTGQCDNFLHLFKLFAPVRIFCLLFLSILALKRLSNTESIP